MNIRPYRLKRSLKRMGLTPVCAERWHRTRGGCVVTYLHHKCYSCTPCEGLISAHPSRNFHSALTVKCRPSGVGSAGEKPWIFLMAGKVGIDHVDMRMYDPAILSTNILPHLKYSYHISGRMSKLHTWAFPEYVWARFIFNDSRPVVVHSAFSNNYRICLVKGKLRNTGFSDEYRYSSNLTTPEPEQLLGYNSFILVCSWVIRLIK